MDFGLAGKTALVCAASRGLGAAAPWHWRARGSISSSPRAARTALEATAAEIRAATGVKVSAVTGDITTPEGRAAALAACPSPDILVTNAGGPPPGDFREWDRDVWIKALDANMLTPIELIKATVDGMIARRFGRIVNITSGAVKAPIDELGLSNGARSGLTGFVAGLARKVARHNVTINNLLPGAIRTARLRSNNEAFAKARGMSVPEVEARADRVHPRRPGRHARGIRRRLRLPVQPAGELSGGQNVLWTAARFPARFDTSSPLSIAPAEAFRYPCRGSIGGQGM